MRSKKSRLLLVLIRFRRAAELWTRTGLTLIELVISNPKASFCAVFEDDRRSPHASCISWVGNYGARHGDESGQGGSRSNRLEPNARETGGRHGSGSYSGSGGAGRRSGVDVRFGYRRG